MAQASSSPIGHPPITDHDVERWLTRLLLAWAAVGFTLAALWGVLIGALGGLVGLLAVGFWVVYAVAGMVIAALTVQHLRHASSWMAGLALAAGVPVVAAGLWYGAELLRTGGFAVAAWVSAI